MSYRTKLSIINGLIWTIMFVIFSISFFSSNYPVTLPLSNYRITTAILFLLPNISNIIILVLQRKHETTDERNKRFESISSTAAMIVLLVIVYLGCMSLYVAYEDVGTLSVSWLWYIAYSTAFLAFIVFNLTYVIVSIKGLGYEN